MTPLYRGFDGLDVSFRAQISEELHAKLEDAKLEAQSSHDDTCLPFAGMMLRVASTGARGGYAFRVSTGKTGATWFFKKPNPRDPWGVRVSCSSFMLAEHSLGGARSKLYEVMDKLGVHLEPHGESISRVDFAVDILAPEFTLSPSNFVMHSNANRADHLEYDEVSVHGKSGRVTSVTVGKMPGRQIIVYDKRAEVIAKHKWPWFDIWNATCRNLGLPELDVGDASKSRVWRTEVRAGKQHLREQWNIRTWADLDNRFGDLAVAAADAVRLTDPCGDTNRSRWPNSEFWQLLQSELCDDLFEMRNLAPPDTIKRVHKEAHLELLERQSLGLLITRAAITGVTIDELADFARANGETFARKICSASDVMKIRLSESAARYEAKS